MSGSGKHEWSALVVEHLAPSLLVAEQHDEIVSEFASHLEEVYEEARSRGLDDSTALHFALDEVRDWNALADNIRRAKSREELMIPITKRYLLPAMAVLFAIGVTLVLLDRAAIVQRLIWITEMALLLRTAASEASRLSPRIRSLWLPALMNLTLAFGLFIILDALNLDEPGIATAGNVGKAFRMPWLLPLPILGAVGALLARRAQASRAERILSGLAPSLVWFAVLAILGTIFALDRRDFAGVSLHDLAVSAVGLVILPALALLLGTMPFLRDSKAVAT